jgi:hypothetical protein
VKDMPPSPGLSRRRDRFQAFQALRIATMTYLFFAQARKRSASSVKIGVAALMASLSMAASQAAKADELEDILVRLAAAVDGQTTTGSVTNIIGVNGIYGAIVSGSANGSQGIMALNQDAGPGGTSQANIVVVALSTGPDAAALARLLGEQSYQSQQVGSQLPTPFPPSLSALLIADSYIGGSGIAQINQSAGEGNSQRNATLMAAALGGGSAQAVTEADLAALGTIERSTSPMTGQRGFAAITGSFTDFSGIAQVNQTIGAGNLVSNTVSITYAGVPAGGR